MSIFGLSGQCLFSPEPPSVGFGRDYYVVTLDELSLLATLILLNRLVDWGMTSGRVSGSPFLSKYA